MTESKRFPAEKLARLDSPERHAIQPPGALVALAAAWKPRTVLDIGVGTGYFALPLAEALPDARVVGLDVEPQMLEVLAERSAAVPHGDRVEPLQAPEDSIPMEDGAVDLVLMVNLYHELVDRAAYLRDVKRVLAPGGRLLICDWDPDAPREHGPPMDHRVSTATARVELEAAGFAPPDHHALYDSQYTLAAKLA